MNDLEVNIVMASWCTITLARNEEYSVFELALVNKGCRNSNISDLGYTSNRYSFAR